MHSACDEASNNNFFEKKNSFFSLYAVLFGVFWVNIVKSELYLRYKNCSKLFKIMKKENEFRYHHCRNSTKSMREKEKRGERENVEFR